MGTRRVPGKIGCWACSGVALCTSIGTIPGRSRGIDSEVAPYRWTGRRPDGKLTPLPIQSGPAQPQKSATAERSIHLGPDVRCARRLMHSDRI